MLYKIWPGLGEAVSTYPQACKGFLNFSFGTTEDFHS